VEYASTLLACLEMIGNGTTCFVEAGDGILAGGRRGNSGAHQDSRSRG